MIRTPPSALGCGGVCICWACCACCAATVADGGGSKASAAVLDRHVQHLADLTIGLMDELERAISVSRDSG